MSKKQSNIEQHEKDILEDFEKGKFVSVANLDEEMQLAKQAASNFMKHNNRINIRVSGADLNKILNYRGKKTRRDTPQ